MSIRAKLKIVLQADETVVAESDDAALWQKILVAINSGSTDFAGSTTGAIAPNPTPIAPDGGSPSDPLGKFAAELGLSREEVQGACSPLLEAPYLHLDVHCWEAMKKQTPERGPAAYSAMAVSATLLALWFRASGLGSPTQAQAQGVLGTIGVRDQNPSRGIERSEWLQSRPGGTIVLNPAKISQATTLAKSFCSKNWNKSSE